MPLWAEAAFGWIGRNLEILSIFLDSIAFLLVTTDLYGEERIRQLAAKLEGWLRPLFKVLNFFVPTSLKSKAKTRDAILHFVGYFVLYLACVGYVYCLNVYVPAQTGSKPDYYSGAPLNGSFYATLLIMIGVGYLCYFAILFTYAFVWIQLKLLSRFTGTLIYFGAILFFLARILSAIHVYYPESYFQHH